MSEADGAESVLYGWSVNQESLGDGIEAVLDQVFDAAGLYNVCVTAFNRGELT